MGSLDSAGEESAGVHPKGDDLDHLGWNPDNNHGGESAADVRPVVDDLDNLDWEPDYDVGEGVAKTARDHRSKGDYLAHFKVRLSSSFVSCVLERLIVLRGIRVRVYWWPG